MSDSQTTTRLRCKAKVYSQITWFRGRWDRCSRFATCKDGFCRQHAKMKNPPIFDEKKDCEAVYGP